MKSPMRLFEIITSHMGDGREVAWFSHIDAMLLKPADHTEEHG